MKYTFADTPFYVATTHRRDTYHAKAIALADQLEGSILTTDFVLVEIANFFSDPPGRLSFLNLLNDLDADPWTTVVPASRDLLLRGVVLYEQRLDKAWSLTDCISFVVMQDHDITEALTADRHFEQAGFAPLLV